MCGLPSEPLNCLINEVTHLAIHEVEFHSEVNERGCARQARIIRHCTMLLTRAHLITMWIQRPIAPPRDAGDAELGGGSWGTALGCAVTVVLRTVHHIARRSGRPRDYTRRITQQSKVDVNLLLGGLVNRLVDRHRVCHKAEHHAIRNALNSHVMRAGRITGQSTRSRNLLNCYVMLTRPVTG